MSVAGIAALGPGRASASTSPDFFGRDHVVATLISGGNNSTSVVGNARDGSGAVQFTLMPDADALRGDGQVVADFSSFAAGEEVFFGGNRSGSSMEVTHLRSIFRVVEGAVTASSDGAVSVDGQTYSVTPQVARRINPAILAPGTRVSAEVWDDPDQSIPALIALVPRQ